MSRRILQQYVYDVARECKGQTTTGEAFQALQDSIQLIDSKGNWEFLLARAMVVTNVGYSAGKVAYGATDQVTVTLSGGTWDPTWVYNELKVSTRRLALRVATFNSPTQLTLLDPVAKGFSATADPYLLLQARYALPSDCEPGRELSLKAPPGYGVLGDGVVPKRERLRSEMRANEYRLTGPIEWYTDDDVDYANQVPTIRFWPAPSVSIDCRLTYYRTMRLPSSMTDVVDIPQAFEKLLVNLAAAMVMKRRDMQGWTTRAAEAGQMMNDLYARHATSAAYDDEPEIDQGFEGNRAVGISNQLFTR